MEAEAHLTARLSKKAQEDQHVAQMKKVQAELDQAAKAVVKAQEKLKTLKNLSTTMALKSRSVATQPSLAGSYSEGAGPSESPQNLQQVQVEIRLPRL